MLQLDHVSARYNMLKYYVNAVNDVNFTINDNEIFGIAGESGCGKSTLLKVIYDLLEYPLEISSGKVSLVSNKTGKIYTTGNIRSTWWKEISYVPQGAKHVMNPVKKVETQFFDAIGKDSVKKMDKAQMRERIIRYFHELGLSTDVLSAYPHQLSGGMKQRVLIALATFLSPSIILADEPTTALDVVVQKDILLMLMDVQRKVNNSIVIVSHDMGVHYQITNRMAIMYAGEVIEIGKTDEIFNRPKHPYTQMLIGALPKVEDSSQKEGIPGTPPSLVNLPEGCRFAERCKYATASCRRAAPAVTEVEPGHFVKCVRVMENNDNG